MQASAQKNEATALATKIMITVAVIPKATLKRLSCLSIPTKNVIPAKAGTYVIKNRKCRFLVPLKAGTANQE
jgi:hypothetical protein